VTVLKKKRKPVQAVKKKKDKNFITHEILQERAEQEIEKFKELARHRFKMAKEAYEFQDGPTQEAIGIIRGFDLFWALLVLSALVLAALKANLMP
jgi:hypothetical protein